jgi:hypothetical protein
MFTPADCNNVVYIMCGDHSHYLHTKSHITSSDAALLIAIKLQNESKQFTKSTHSVDKMLVTNVNGREH